MAKRSCCLRRLGGDRNAEVRFGRFLHNERVTAEEIVATAAAHTARAAQGRHVLAIQDTTDLNFTKHAKSKRGFGRIGRRSAGLDVGLYLHPVIVVEAAGSERVGVDHAGAILGLAGASIYRRDPAPEPGPKSGPKSGPLRDRKRKISDRESARWLKGVSAASDALAASADTVTVVGDRESDIYELFAQERPGNVHLLVRAQHDRALSEGGRLFARMAAESQAAGPKINVPAKRGRPARKAATRLAYARVEIKQPGRLYGGSDAPRSITVSVVRVEEVDPPPGEKPIQWLLLTTHPIESRAQALLVVEWYRAPWTIEQLFRTMKAQGFDIEDSQIETFETMRKLAAAALVAALRTLQLVHARNGDTGQKLTDAIQAEDEPLVEALVVKLEGRTERLKCPHAKGSLGRVAWVVGRLGGWNGYVGKSHKPAGPKTMALGLIQFDAIRKGWRLTIDV